MLDNTLSLSVDVANNNNPSTQEYRRAEEMLHKSTYKGADNSLTSRDQIAFYRTPPKVSGNFRGVAKSAVKITQDTEVPGVDSSTSFTAPAIVDIGFALPVGTTPALALELRQRAIAILDSAFIEYLHEKQEI